MPKNIVICCDGTGNEVSDTNSNVVKLYSTLTISAEQVGYYHPGVGTLGAPNASTWMGKQWTRLKGLGFGYGLMTNIGDAYRYLMNTYEEGDRIFLFGFSRGAYTARALAGMIHMYGLLCPGNEGLIPYITTMFARHSRNQGGMKHTFQVAEIFKSDFSRDCVLHFVGVWDTVSSVGWVWSPVVLPYSGRNPIVRTGRHAVSIDERRCYYRDNLWGPLFEKSDSEFRIDQDIKQVWFSGVHSDVGGSYAEAESGLSKITLEWMLAEASAFGLVIDSRKAAVVLGRDPKTEAFMPDFVSPDPKAMLHKSLRGFWWILELFPHTHYDKQIHKLRWRIPFGVRRHIPDGAILHDSVLERKNSGIGYNPPNLPSQYSVEPRKNFPLSKAAAE
jgi:uncharacterized protein (DUF2235 family)